MTCGNEGRKHFFSEEKKQKTFMSLDTRRRRVTLQEAKVFCFFFSKKKCFLSSYPPKAAALPKPTLPAAALLLALAAPAHAATQCNIGALSALAVDGVTIVTAAQSDATCVVFGTLNTSGAPPGSAGFQLRLPATWNHKFIMFGVGGYAGADTDPSANETDVATSLARGYAAIITDTGHQGVSTDASWALIAPGVPAAARIEDYLYRATHQVTQAGKTLVARFYGQPIREAYFDGCSNGGRQALTEAANYPADYDGIIAGAPFFDAHVQLAALSFFRQQLGSPQSYVPSAKLPAISAAILQSCDAADGVRDGLIQNPAICAFDPATLICKGAETNACLTAPQAETIRTYFTATHDSAGAYLYTGWPVGALAGADIWNFGATRPSDLGAPEPWGNAGFPPAPIGWQFVDHLMKFIVAQNAGFDARLFLPTPSGPISQPNLTLFDDRLKISRPQPSTGGFNLPPQAYAKFDARRGKLLLYHGLADPALSPFSTARLYERMAALTPGGYASLRQSARLFMVPGMQHCGGGDAPDVFDTLTPLEHWVEQGQPPAQIQAVHRGPKGIDRSMPLCPFPQQAAYSGKGSLNDAANWSCPPNQSLLKVGQNGTQSGL
jgi:feruloyl esterase